ncbi:MAG: glycerophosphodiester phosphodiesterase [Propionibacteriaceae bacterium]|nr:glycerophosphodiester phosphodiesterase [Propionibacteriaceae bacterium]
MVKVWAHRGGSSYAPENTMAAFAKAVELGVDGLEFDVQLTADEEVVVVHDETLERTTDGRGWVKDHSLAALKRLDASGGRPGFAGERIPTLREVLDFVAPTGLALNIELKNSVVSYFGLPDKVCQLVDEYGLEARVIVSSFNHCALAWLRQGGSMVRTGLLFQDVLYEPWVYAAQLWATALHPNYRYIDYVFNLIDEAHLALFEVNTWTVNDEHDIDRMIARGVDGIITDCPEVALARRG